MKFALTKKCSQNIHILNSIHVNVYNKRFKICIFWQHFFVDTNFIKHNRHFMFTYFLLDPFEFPYYFYRIRGGIDLCIVHSCMYPKYFLSDFGPSSEEDLLQKWCNFCFSKFLVCIVVFEFYFVCCLSFFYCCWVFFS